ncbi:MAG: hypothetical protein GVY26_12140 [Bacteroidetes bacterium]|jgi:hypothetical protein|nr:hypothetical protein [Bacteroidota bacterium]
MQNTFLLSKVLAINILWLFCGQANAQEGAWKLARETDGLKVYLRDAADSDIKEIKIETTLNASLDAVVSVLKDVPVYDEWIYKCLEARRLEASTNTSSLYYCKLDFPWPMSDRDFIAQSQLRQDPDSRTVYIDVKGLPNYKPAKKGIVRINDLSIHYELVPLSAERVQMTYRLHSDPGGSIPAWLVNLVVDNGPTNTVKGMRDKLKEAKYQNARLAFLK